MAGDMSSHVASRDTRVSEGFATEPEPKVAPTEPSPCESKLPLPIPTVLEVLYGAQDAEVDIFFVHDLYGHRIDSWTIARPERGCCWAADLLPTDIPRSRIATWGYDSSFLNTKAPITFDQQALDDLAKSLRSDVEGMLESDDHRPIIFVAHGFGGVICKAAFLSCKTASESGGSKRLLNSTVGIVFFGTNNSASLQEQWTAIMASAVDSMQLADWRAVDQLVRSGNPNLIELRNRFDHLLEARQQVGKPIGVRNFVATESSLKGGKNIPLAPTRVAGRDETCMLSDHRNMVKFSDRNDSDYLEVIGRLLRWLNVDGDKRQIPGRQFPEPLLPGPQYPITWEELPAIEIDLGDFDEESYDQSYSYGQPHSAFSNVLRDQCGDHFPQWQGGSFDPSPMIRTTVKGDEASEVSIDMTGEATTAK